jgi:HAD superfamily hydrolase (TIGR01484 family)
MRYKSLASDFDGTLAEDGKIFGSTLASLERLKTSGRKVILVTGRVLDDLCRTFPEYAICDRIVAENGALVYDPADCSTKRLAAAPHSKLVEALRQRRVGPLEIGWSIVAAPRAHADAILQAIRDLGLELQAIYNKDAVMVLPADVDKGTGLLAALTDLGLSADGTVGVGDAENDFALLSACGCGVAVANAVPELKECADITTAAPTGKGVEELIEHMLRNDLSDVPVRPRPATS